MKNSVGLDTDERVLYSITEELLYYGDTPNHAFDAIDHIWGKFKSRGFKRITVRKIYK